jgi:hypothetical protein
VLYGNRGGGTDDFRLRDFYQAGAFNARVMAFISTVPKGTKGEDLGILARLVADCRVRPQIGWTGDWIQTADALAAMARREFPTRRGGAGSTPTASSRSVEQEPSGKISCQMGGGSRCLFK